MPRLLTVRKEKWRNTFKPDLLRGTSLAPNAAVGARYQAALEHMIEQMTNEMYVQIVQLFETDHAEKYFATDASISSQARIVTNMLNDKFTKLFAGNSKQIADYFAGQSDRASSKAVHLSVKKLSGGLSLPTVALSGDLTEIFKATVAENVSLIKSIPQKYLGQVEQLVFRSITTGNGLKDLAPGLQKYKDITYARAKMIAHDQTRKAFQGMAAERVKRLGIKKAEWIHVPSNHPRKTHIAMNGKIYNIEEGLYDSQEKRKIMPAELVNCRCMMRPIITFED